MPLDAAAAVQKESIIKIKIPLHEILHSRSTSGDSLLSAPLGPGWEFQRGGKKYSNVFVQKVERFAVC